MIEYIADSVVIENTSIIPVLCIYYCIYEIQVNTLAWNKAGDKLLSGSDDCLLNIYQPYSYKV